MSELYIPGNEFDLSGGDDVRQNNVCVAQETLDVQAPDVPQEETNANALVYSLLRGRAADRKRPEAGDNQDAKLFRLLSLSELEQAIVNISYYYNVRNLVPESALGSFQISGLEDAGLHYNPETFTIEGVPNHLGTFQLTISFNIKGSPFSKLMNLKVITLWKYVDPPADLPFPKANSDSAALIVDMYRMRGLKNVAAASVRGRSHAYDGKPRDDDFRLSFHEATGWYMCVVSDGAGSARYSREGSRVLVEQMESVFSDVFSSSSFSSEVLRAVETYAQDCDDNAFIRNCTEIMVKPLKTALDRTIACFEETAGSVEGARLYDFSTTCLLSVFRRCPRGWIVFTYNVGDGAIAMINDHEGYAAILCNPDEGRYFGETRFVTTEGVCSEDNIRRRILVNYVRDFDALILMTDGVSDPKFESDRNLHDSRRWLDFYRELAGEVSLYGCNDELREQLMKYLEFWSIGNHDDRTLAVVF